MKPKRTLAGASVNGRPEIKISGPDWERIQSQYGHQIPTNLRSLILAATEDFAWWAEFELTAPPAKEAEQSLSKVLKGVKKLVEDLQHLIDRKDDGARQLRSMIERNFDCAHVPSATGKLRFASQVVRSLRDACCLAQCELHNSGSYVPGDQWDAWVRKLTAIAHGQGLPTGARKDDQPGKAASAFVALVRELQCCVPCKLRRHAHSDGALAQAITKARQKSKPHLSSRAGENLPSPKSFAL